MKYIALDEFLKGASPTTLEKDVQRQMDVANLKEIYSEEYLLKHKLCTPEEYNSIPASTSRADDRRRAQDEAELRHQVVGAEVPSGE